MKKILAMILALLMALSCGAQALAEEEEKQFDYTLMKTFPGYDYDAFEKEWSVYGACYKKYTDATLVLGIKCVGTKTEMDKIYMYCWWRDAANKNKERDIEGIDFIIDDVMYSYEKLIDNGSNSYVYLSRKAEPLLTAIANSREMAVRFRVKGGNTRQNFSVSEYTDLRMIAKRIVESDLWSYNPFCDDEKLSMRIENNTLTYTNMYSYCDINYPLTIEE